MTRVISISDEAYEKLRMMKDDKSFSEIIIEITREKGKNNLMKWIGSISKEDAKRIKKQIYEDRKIPSRRFQ